MESPFSGMEEGRFSHGPPQFRGLVGESSRGTIDFHCVGDIRLRLGDGRGNLREEPRRPRPYSRGGRGDIAIQGVARRFLTATGRMPPRSRIWAMRQRGAARHAATNAPRTPDRGVAPIDTQGFACSGWGFSAAGAWRGCAGDKNAIPRIGGGAGDPKPNFARPARPEPNAEASLWSRDWRSDSPAM